MASTALLVYARVRRQCTHGIHSTPCICSCSYAPEDAPAVTFSLFNCALSKRKIKVRAWMDSSPIDLYHSNMMIWKSKASAIRIPAGIASDRILPDITRTAAILGPCIQDLPLSKSYCRSAELKQWRSTLASLRSIAHSFASCRCMAPCFGFAYARGVVNNGARSINRHGFLKFLIERLAGDRQGDALYIQWWFFFAGIHPVMIDETTDGCHTTMLILIDRGEAYQLTGNNFSLHIFHRCWIDGKVCGL
jgi:hypothetical protein